MIFRIVKVEEEKRKFKDIPVILLKLVKILLKMKIFITLSSNFPTRRETKGGRTGATCGKILIKTFPFVRPQNCFVFILLTRCSRGREFLLFQIKIAAGWTLSATIRTII
jgi:hypothetical protein